MDLWPMSDHLATHTKLSLGSSTLTSRINATNSKQHKVGSRLFNEANHEKFKDLINTENWYEITDDMDAQTAFNK